ncbi:hypothetical protein ABZT51_31280 [Streptomyces sp. NPDC005373]
MVTTQTTTTGQEPDTDYVKARTACLDIVITSLPLADSGPARIHGAS